MSNKRLKKLRRIKHISSALIRTASLNSQIEILKQGENLSEMEDRAPGFIEALVNENKSLIDYLNRWRAIEYLGSGATGDAWLLRNGLVLKIFDNNLNNSLRKYIDISNDEESRAYAILEPMVHGYSLLNVPVGYEDVPPSIKIFLDNRGRKRERKRRNDNYAPAFVIVEKIKTLTKYVDEYLDKNPSSMGYPDQYAEEEGDYRYVDNLLNSLPDAIKKIYNGMIYPIGPPEWLIKDINRWVKNGNRPTVQYVTMHFAERVISRFTLGYIKGEFIRMLAPSLKVDGEEPKSPFDTDEGGVSYIDIWAKQIAQDIYREVVFDPSFSELQAVASLIGAGDSRSWIENLAKTTLVKLARGHGDLHFENLGRRTMGEQDTTGDSDFVYFDS